MKKIGFIIVVMLFLLMFTGCDERPPSADQIATRQTNIVMSEMARTVGQPEIVNFQEKKLAKLLYELRDQSDFVTYAYAQGYNGKFIYLGRAVGYGLPYSAQYTNPQRLESRSTYGIVILPQPEPNGLFMPDGLSATWIMLIDEDTGDIAPMYFEPNLAVYPHKLPRRLVEEWSLTEDY